MPTYDYRCKNCGDFEHVQKITEPRLEECPRCGGLVEKLISRNVGIIFKGSGFYITDHRDREYKKAAATDSGRESKDTAAKDAGGKNSAGQDTTGDAPTDSA